MALINLATGLPFAKQPRKRKTYTVQWGLNGQNVSLTATTDYNAKRQADALARRLGTTGMTRTIYEGGRCVE